MAVLGRLLVSSAERLDLPDLLSLDSYAAGDWRYFLKGLVGDSKPFILKGFDIIDPGNAIGTQSCSIRVADSVTFYPGSNSGSFFHGLQEGHTQAVPLVPELRKNAVNYVYLTFSTFNTSVDTRAFWDPDKDGGAGGEFTQDVNTESVLQVQVNVSTGSFPANTVPVAKVTVGPVVITAIEDARDMMFRLGSGGISPNPFSTYSWRSLPSAPYQRSEPPTTMLAGGTNPFQGADKNILSLKEWMDAIMSKLRELGGTTYWYDDTSSYSLISNFIDSVATAFKSKGKWLHDTVTPGLLTWTEDLNIKITTDPRTYIVRQGNKTLTDEQVMYVPMVRNQQFNTTDESVQWVNGQNYVNTIGGAVGLFTNLAKGDFVKKANDTPDKWLRVEEFYDAVNLGGSTTTAALARSIRLSSAYLGVTLNEKGRYDKGVYLASDVVVSNRNTAAISNIGGNFHWLAIRSDTIENVGNIVTTTLTVDITDHDGTTAKVTASGVHGLIDGDRVTITGSTNFDGTYRVEVESATVFYITLEAGPFADESSRTARYATVTTAARSTAYSLQLESANHGFKTEDTIIVAGTTNYNGSYEVSVRDATNFTIPVSAANATETTGTATLARAIVRTEGSVTQIIQGQIVDIGGTVADNIRQYVGMSSLSETNPTYAIPPSYNTLDGTVNYNSSISENLTTRVSKLTAMMADKAQDKTIKLLPSGYQSVSNVVNGIYRDITFIPSASGVPRLDVVLPSSDDIGSSYVDLNGITWSLQTYQAVYITIDRNAAFPTVSTTIGNIATIPLDENILVLAVRLGTSEVWLWDGFYVSGGIVVVPGFLQQIIQQNQTLKLVEGGTWSWDLGTETLTWSADAFVQIPGLANSANQIIAGSVVLNAGEVATLNINRAGVGGAITATPATNASLATTADMFIMARREGADVVVGLHSMRLTDGESKKLYAGVSDQHLTYTGAPNQANTTPAYTGPKRNIVQGQSLTAGISNLDTELDKFFGQLQLRPASPISTRVLITGVDFTMLNTAVLGQELVGSLMKFDGAEIDFATGNIYEADGITPLGENFTPETIAANQYRWYSVSLIPNVLDGQNKITAQVLVLPASADGATAALAPRAVFGGTKKLGQVFVQDDGTGGSGTILNIAQANCVQLGIGSGSGGGGSSPKLIGGGTFSWNSGTNQLSFTSDIFVEQPRLDYVDNTIDQATVSPITLSTTNHVAFIERLNASSGGPDLTVLVDLITNVKDGQTIIARRVGTDVIVGSSSTRLKNGQSTELYAQASNQTLTYIGAPDTADSTPAYSSNIRGVAAEGLTARVGSLTDAMGDSQEDRSAYLRSDDPVTWTGSQLQFTADVVLEVVNTKSGTVKTATILLANSPIILANNESAWVLIDRTLASENLTVNLSGTTPIPAQTQANKDVIVIGRRQDALGAGYLHLPLHKQVLEPGQTVRLGASGSGDGGGNEILESLKNQLIDGYFELITPNIFKVDKEIKIDGASTGDYSLIDKTFNFAASTVQTMLSTDMLDPEEFITSTDALAEIELSVYWRLANIDTTAVYEVSRNAGLAWQTVTMERVGTTDVYRGYHKFVDEVVNQTLYSPVVSGDLDASNQLSQSFVIAAGDKKLVKSTTLTITKTGVPAGYVYVSICADNAGSPGTVLSESAAILADSLGGTTTINIPDVYLAAGTYHIKIRSDAAYKASYVNGVTELSLTGSTVLGIELDLRLRVSSSSTAGIKKLEGYGIFYNKSLAANTASGSINVEVFEFAGSSNTYEFTLTKFVPHADLLKVYDVNTGQVYDYGAFGFNGQKVVFESGQFYQPGQTIKLRFIQVEGSAFDSSDVNGLLLATNHLGSSDPSIDRSIAGRGIILRRPDNVLIELSVDNSNNIVISSV